MTFIKWIAAAALIGSATACVENSPYGGGSGYGQAPAGYYQQQQPGYYQHQGYYQQQQPAYYQQQQGYYQQQPAYYQQPQYYQQQQQPQARTITIPLPF